MTTLTDTHCHLAHLRSPLADALEAAERAGVSRVVDIGMGVEESRAAAARATEYEGRVFAAVGVHPNDLRDLASFGAIEHLAARAGVVAVGETGLDFYRERSPRERQEEAFRLHIALAKTSGRTLVVHCRDAQERVLRVLDEEGPPDRVVMHCFSGDVDVARRCAQRGYWCSFAGNVTYKANDVLREAARALPRELLLVETDAPYLAPLPHRGRDNEPALVAITARALAAALGHSFEAVAERTTANAARAFDLPNESS